ncbi:hypothetical protein Vafri_15320 [Volvox africanus]|uniref:Mitochondrial substrate carrier n=1 Tax=Volvox africanus TaxID=51714 RepID=A0A8J4BHG7_9CHLO|nr:hypothetical protein Vafri_15320 [Volvox africanus]
MRGGDIQGDRNPHELQQRRRRELPTAARELLAGFAAGAANVTSGYPFDTVKVRLQSAAPGQYRGAMHCLCTIVQQEGVRRGLFRGLSSPLVGGTAETGINYMVYSRVLDALRPDDSSTIPLTSVAVAGAVAGVALSVVLGPTELVKCRMQQAGSAARYPDGPLQCLREIVATEGGLRGLSRGLGATMAREVPGNALFFAVYEALRRGLLGAQQQQQQQTTLAFGPGASEPLTPRPVSGLTDLAVQVGSDVDSGWWRANCSTGPSRPGHLKQHGDDATRYNWLTEAAIAVFCGGTAGTLMWAAVLPIDVAKTRLQTARPGSKWDVRLWSHWVMVSTMLRLLATP